MQETQLWKDREARNEFRLNNLKNQVAAVPFFNEVRQLENMAGLVMDGLTMSCGDGADWLQGAEDAPRALGEDPGLLPSQRTHGQSKHISDSFELAEPSHQATT